MALEGVQDPLRLFPPQEPVVDEDADELVADGLVDKGGGHRGVYPAGEGAEHPPLAYSPPDILHRLDYEMARRPSPSTAANFVKEVVQDLLSVRGMDNLGVELEAYVASLIAHSRHGRV